MLCILKSEHEFIEDTLFSQSIREYIIKQNPSGLKEDSIHAALDHSIFDWNRTNALYKFENDTKNVAEFKFVEKCANTYQVLEPWQVLIDLGPASSHFEYEVIVEVLRDFNKTSIRGLAHTLIILSNKFAQEDNRNNLEVITMKWNMKGDMTYINQDPNEYPKQIYEWNKENLTKALKEIYTSTAWIELIKFLDVDLDAREDLYFQSQQAFAIFIDLWMQLKPSQKQFPIEFLIANTWKNKKAQVICLDYAINYSYINQDIPFEKAKRRQDQVIQIQGIKPTAATYLRIWKWIDLVQTLVILSESPYYHRVRSLFDQPIRFIPEYLLLSLIKSKPKTGQIIVEDLYAHLLPSFLTGHTNSTPVLSEIWTINKELVINSMAELYKLNPKKMNLSRVLDISQSIKNSLLDIITNTKDYNFALQLGMLGAKRDFLHFENWIKMLIQNQGDPFVRCLLSYIKKNLFQPIEEQKDDKNIIEKALERSLLSEEKLCMIYENLHQLSEKDQTLLEYDTQKILSESFSKAVQLFPSIHTEQKNNDEIEEKANEYFQQLYKGEKEVDDLVKIMKDFRQSQNATEREIYAWMVQNLFDEWKFFPKYPKKELWMTAKLFGKIISEKKIIDGVVTDIGLKWIVEGLKRDGKMFEFTITALEEWKDSIEYEAGLMDILECKQLKDKKPDLYEYINKRYLDIKAASEESVPIEDTKLTNQPALNINIQNPLKQEIKEEKIMIMPGQFNARSPDPGMMMEGSFPAKLMRINKQPQANPALIGTPTAPGKYYNYNDPNKNQRLGNF